MAAKQKLRYSSKGWFFHAFDWHAGVVDKLSGMTFPDNFGHIGTQEVWVGPFDTFKQAIQCKRQYSNNAWANNG